MACYDVDCSLPASPRVLGQVVSPPSQDKLQLDLVNKFRVDLRPYGGQTFHPLPLIMPSLHDS
jgi:hypothetical protein